MTNPLSPETQALHADVGWSACRTWRRPSLKSHRLCGLNASRLSRAGVSAALGGNG